MRSLSFLHSMRRSSLILVLVVALSLSACSKPISRDDGDVLEVREFNTVMQTEKDLIDPVHGRQTAVWYGALNGVGGTNANGVGFVHMFEDGVSVMTVNLNVLPAKKDSHFVAVLSDQAGTKKITIGEVSSIIGDARHSAKFQTDADVTGMSVLNVYSVLQSESVEYGTLVASGTLKEAPKN